MKKRKLSSKGDTIYKRKSFKNTAILKATKIYKITKKRRIESWQLYFF